MPFVSVVARVPSPTSTQTKKKIPNFGKNEAQTAKTLIPDVSEHHINEHNFRVSFVCGCQNLGEALCRVREGATMIWIKGDAGTGNIIEAVRHVWSVIWDIRVLWNMDDDEVFTFTKKIAAPYDMVMQTKQLRRLHVVHFTAGSFGMFKSGDLVKRGRAIVQAMTHYRDPDVLGKVTCGLGEAMVGLNLKDEKVERLANRSK
ncbi:hypothetical protein PRUPE_8G053100 [Prunus persica]|uniref:PdxS/SNZ N-terminal domain-containing protein n=1 Tax=Prunus persica TaxID=3760 RepID=A0A251MWL5_PRUPE|nr:hypothetical protein PRUPE_8G053100 [Prunus persica]